jgi:iron-sulfur cluster assembly protein
MITLTEKAAGRVRSLLERQGRPAGAGLRIRILGGGCSGLSYELDLEDSPKPGDEVVEEHGVRLFLDPKSKLCVDGSVVDYTGTVLQSRFEIRNPNAKSSCSCGESFSI